MTTTTTHEPRAASPPGGGAARPTAPGGGSVGLLLAAPAVALLALFVVLPGVLAFCAAFFRVDIRSGVRWTWAGLSNVTGAFADPAVVQSLVNTLLYSLYTIVPSLVIGFLLALLVNSVTAGRGVVRTLLFLPFTANLVAMAVVFRYIFDYRDGFANNVLALAGIAPVNYLGDPATALPTVAAVGVWRCASLAMILFLAGLTSIPTAIDEAAAADGIRGITKLRTVTLPLLRPVTVFTVVFIVLQSVQVFDTINVMTGGGPQGATETVLTMVWRLGFEYYDLGQGAVLSALLLIVLVSVGVLRRKTLSEGGR